MFIAKLLYIYIKKRERAELAGKNYVSCETETWHRVSQRKNFEKFLGKIQKQFRQHPKYGTSKTLAKKI